MGKLCHGHLYQVYFGLHQDGKGKPLSLVHSVVTGAEHQSVRKFDSAKSNFEWFEVQETRGRKDQLKHYTSSSCSSKW